MYPPYVSLVRSLYATVVIMTMLLLTFAYYTYVRPRIDFASQAWSPHAKYLINHLERIQKVFTRRLRCASGLSYQERLNQFYMDSLETRRIKTDLITLYKIVHGLLDIILMDICLSLNVPNTRAHNVKLILPSPRSNILKCYFAYRTGVIYKRLPSHVLSASSFVTYVCSMSACCG